MPNGRLPSGRFARCKDPICLICCVLVVCIVLGAFCITFRAVHQPFQKLVDDRLAMHVSVVPHTSILDECSKVREENVTYYFLNVTNPMDVMRGSIPNFVEVGPFTYTKKQLKYNCYWTWDETVELYDRNISYVPINRVDSLNPNEINITTLNIPLITLVNLYQNPVLRNDPANQNLFQIIKLALCSFTTDPLQDILGMEDLFITKSVNELLWGYKDPVFVKIKQAMAAAPVQETFALQENGTEKQNLMFTGSNDTSLTGKYVKWNGLSLIEQWGTPTASMINGTDGTIFGANLSNSTNLYVFSDSSKRSFFLEYRNITSLYGIDCYRYVLPKEAFSNESDPGFYPNGPYGVVNISAVELYNTPFFLSNPHFLDADPGYLQNVSGLQPIPEQYEYYIDVEPITGTVFRDKKTSQYNILLQQYEGLDQFSNLRNLTMFPVFISAESFQITEESSKVFKTVVSETNVGTKVTINVLVAVTGTCLAFIVTTLCVALFAVRAMHPWRTMKRQAGVDVKPHQKGIVEKTPLVNPDLSIKS